MKFLNLLQLKGLNFLVQFYIGFNFCFDLKSKYSTALIFLDNFLRKAKRRDNTLFACYSISVKCLVYVLYTFIVVEQ